MTEGTELELVSEEVLDRRAGEILDVASASTQRLAEVITNTTDLRRELDDVEEIVASELIDRLDRDANWTWHGDGLTVVTASPGRGTEDFPVDALEEALGELVFKGVISEEAASKAIKRQIVLTLDVPLGAHLGELTAKSREWTINAGGVETPIELPVVKAASKVEKIANGIKAIRKNPAAAKVMDKAAVPVNPPARKVKVTRE